MDPTTELVEELRTRLERHPSDRYPVQHATAQFHLGTVLADLDRLEEAEAALVEAAALFRGRLPVEEAKSLNTLGAVLRAAGRFEDAARAFGHAAAVFREQGMPLELGAALFNQGLVARELGDPPGALHLFEVASAVLDADLAPVQAAAVRRELGAALLLAERAEEAIAPLSEALDLARRSGDPAGAGAAANALGLAHLVAERPDEAAAAFRDAVGFNPRTVRPESYAMAKANLALACEQLGEPAPARLAARQALAIEGVAEPIRLDAEGVLSRLGDPRGDLLAALDGAPAERWPGIVHDELARWIAAGPAGQQAEMSAWIDGQLARPETGVDLAEAWLAGLLELPPEPMQDIIRSSLAALEGRDAGDRERFRADVSSAMARFHVPQLLRLKDVFAASAAELGHDERWG